MFAENPLDVSDLDALSVPLVLFFNERGLKTYMSCQGHNDTNQSLFWIWFDESVTEDNIAAFMYNHRTQFNIGKFDRSEVAAKWFVSNGHFSERFILYGNGKRDRYWEYAAASPKAAEDDMRKWLAIEEDHRRDGQKDLFETS